MGGILISWTTTQGFSFSVYYKKTSSAGWTLTPQSPALSPPPSPGDVLYRSQGKPSISIDFSGHRLHGYGMAEDFSYVCLYLFHTYFPPLTRLSAWQGLLWAWQGQCVLSRKSMWNNKSVVQQGAKGWRQRWRNVGSHWLKTVQNTVWHWCQ